MKRVYGVQYETTGDRVYDEALRAVSKLLAKNEFVIKELRTYSLFGISGHLKVEVIGRH